MEFTLKYSNINRKETENIYAECMHAKCTGACVFLCVVWRVDEALGELKEKWGNTVHDASALVLFLTVMRPRTIRWWRHPYVRIGQLMPPPSRIIRMLTKALPKYLCRVTTLPPPSLCTIICAILMSDVRGPKGIFYNTRRTEKKIFAVVVKLCPLLFVWCKKMTKLYYDNRLFIRYFI